MCIYIYIELYSWVILILYSNITVTPHWYKLGPSLKSRIRYIYIYIYNKHPPLNHVETLQSKILMDWSRRSIPPLRNEKSYISATKYSPHQSKVYTYIFPCSYSSIFINIHQYSSWFPRENWANPPFSLNLDTIFTLLPSNGFISTCFIPCQTIQLLRWSPHPPFNSRKRTSWPRQSAYRPSPEDLH